jgi:hypothetical protein
MMNLAEYRSKSACLADYLPWVALVAEGAVLNKDGSFQRTASFRGPDLDSATPAELVAVTARLNNAIRRLGSGWALFVEAQRLPSSDYPESHFPDPASALIDMERREQFREEGAHFESRYYLTLLWMPPAEEAALVYDTSGEFVAQYYDPRRGDIILNPFDARCAIWTPFAEIAHPADADRIAQQLITETGQHDRDVWLETSRILVANMIRALWREGKCTLPDLLHALQVRSKDDLKLWLGNSSSARTFADDADRATGSVLFMLAKAANLIQFLRIDEGKETAFSFRDFLSGLDMHPGPKPWIFVPRKEDYFEASKPLLACWLECAASALLGHSPSAERRLWFILDELADLPRVDNLARLLPEGRKFGAAVILTFQAIGQMRHRYGQDLSESMLGCCNTKLFLQMTDSESRQWASDTIGSCEVELPTMTDALADGDYKPRTTLGRQRKVRPAVLESELRLPRHRGYLLFPDGLPVARIALTDDHIVRRGKARQLGYVAGDPTTSLWQQSVEAPPVGTPPVEAEPAVQPSTVPPTEPEPPKPQPSGDGPV